MNKVYHRSYLRMVDPEYKKIVAQCINARDAIF